MTNPQKTTEELVKALDVVVEPMRQLSASLVWHRCEPDSGLSDGEKLTMRNACFMSSLLSLRNLDDFFRTTRKPFKKESGLKAVHGKDDDDLCAEEYGFPAAPLLPEEDRILLNKHLTHLTWKRVRTDSFDAGLTFTGTALSRHLSACIKFLDHVLSDLLKSRILDYRIHCTLRDMLQRVYLSGLNEPPGDSNGPK